MAINTSGYAVNGSIPTLIGPTTKPVVFNYANGQTMAPTSGGQAYANGMIGLGKSLGDSLQEAAQNLNANTIAKNEAARAQAQMQTQLTPMQQALMQAQMGRDTGQANMMGNVYGNIVQQQLAQRAAQQPQAQQSAQGSPMPGTQSSAPSSQMPPPQSNGLIGLNPANAAMVQTVPTPGTYSVNSSANSFNVPGMGQVMIDPASPTGLGRDPIYMKSQEMGQANTNLNAEDVQKTFDNEDAVKDYNTAASNANLLNQMQKQLQNGKSLTNADSVNLMKASAGVFNPGGSSKSGFDPVNVITQQPLPEKLKTAIADFTGNKSNIMSDQTALDLINATNQSFAQQTNNYNVTRANYISRLGGTNLNTPQIINSRLLDRPGIAAQQYGWKNQQKQSAAPQAIQSLAAKAKALHAANPNLTPQQAMQMASGSQ